ncbi:MAG: UbiA-like protein EboC [Acidobacteria bacterium]|nr:UbiA-like protein EboC [Acidobacteriota bacterium]
MRTVPPPPRSVPRRAAPGVAGAYLELLRPANVATALADVLAGVSVAGVSLAVSGLPASLGWLLLATVGLYAGGIVLNDVFDRVVDARERPERPIPSGRVTVGAAAMLGTSLLAGGVGAAAAAGPIPAAIAAAIVLAVVLYDAWGKRHPFIGPVNMGLCRALNLLLGIAIAPDVLGEAWPIGAVPLVYIAAVTMVSRGEVHGAKRPVLRAGLGLVVGVVAALAGIAALGGPPAGSDSGLTHRAWALLLVVALGARVLPVFGLAARTTAAADIRSAVRTGVLSLVLVDAVIAASYAGIMNSLAVLATGLLAWWLARLFAVT